MKRINIHSFRIFSAIAVSVLIFSYFTLPALADYDPSMPSITGVPPQAVEISAGGIFGASFSYMPLYQMAWYDGTGGPFPVDCNPASGSVFPIGTTTVMCTATDTNYPNHQVATSSFDVVTNLVPMTVSLSPVSLATGTADTAYQRPMFHNLIRPVTVDLSSSAEGPFDFSVSSGSLPAGLSISTSTEGRSIIIAGTSTVAGAFPFDITADNGTSSTTQSYSIVIYPEAVSISLEGLSQAYDGSPKIVAASTTPPGVIMAVSYNGSLSVPSAPGIYAIDASSTDPNYAGEATGTMTIYSTAPPVITLNGFSAIDLTVGDTYTEQGATAFDVVDGTTTATVGGDTVNTAVAGTYTVTYDAVDSAGNHAAEIARTVIVTAPASAAAQSSSVSSYVSQSSGAGSSYGGFSPVPLASSVASPVSASFVSSPAAIANANANPDTGAAVSPSPIAASASIPANRAPASTVTASASPSSAAANVPAAGASQAAAVGALGSGNSIYPYIIAALAVLAGIVYLAWNRVGR